MAKENKPHLYDGIIAIKNFIVDVSKIHDFGNSWNYSDTGMYMSRGRAFDSAFQVYSFTTMPVAGVATVLGYAGNAPLEQQLRYSNKYRN